MVGLSLDEGDPARPLEYFGAIPRIDRCKQHQSGPSQSWRGLGLLNVRQPPVSRHLRRCVLPLGPGPVPRVLHGVEPGGPAARGGRGHRRQNGARSHDNRAGKQPIHLVSAWPMTLGQVKTEEKSNEITAIPRLLELLRTIDAWGARRRLPKGFWTGSRLPAGGQASEEAPLPPL